MYNTDIPSRAELPSKGKLLKSTGIAISTATVLLVTAVLPAEYGIDLTGMGKVLGLTSMGKIKTSLAAEAAAEKASATAPKEKATVTPAAMAVSPVDKPATHAKAEARSDEMSVTLKPGEGTEVKLAMKKGEKVSYSWQTDGGLVNHETHGEANKGHGHGHDHGHAHHQSYSKGKQVSADSGELVAAFDGSHGWFWRNRSEKNVTVTLKTTGTYQSIKKMM